MNKSLALAICLFCIGSLSAKANKSVYTSTKTNSCRTIESNDAEDGSYEGECKGAGGFKIRLLEGDLRQSLKVITPAKKTFDLNFWGHYTGFSSVGEKLEWRTKAGSPVALIARFKVTDSADEKKSTSYLMISKLSESSSCVTDVVAPGPKQNEKARELADGALAKPCKEMPN